MRTSKFFFVALFIVGITTLLIGQCFEDPPGSGNFVTSRGEPCVNTIITAVPFLRIAPDARSAGMGDAGIAISADANALHFNVSKLAFSQNDGGIAATYTPWLRGLDVNNVYHGYLSGYTKIGKEKKNAIGLGIRYFSLGEIQFTNANGGPIANSRPKEWEINAAYAFKVSDHFSAGISGKYINSNLAAGQRVGGDEITAGTSTAVDISFSYRKPLSSKEKRDFFSVGAAISNLGTKITYTNSVNKDFIPINLGVGIAWQKSSLDKHQFTFTMDANKLLVPTPDPSQLDFDGDGIPDYKQVSTISGAIHSFGDAPGGVSEELREINFSWGVEYWYNQIFAIRTGYFHEHETKGNRKYFTLGIGGKYRSIGLNASYLIPTAPQRNPLDNTFRISILYDFEN